MCVNEARQQRRALGVVARHAQIRQAPTDLCDEAILDQNLVSVHDPLTVEYRQVA